MDYKEEFKRLLQIVKDRRKQNGFGHRNEDIALVMGYSRSHFSTLMGEKGIITPEHLKILILHFPWLEKQTEFRFDKMLDSRTSQVNEKLDKGDLLELLMQQMTNLMQTQNSLLQDQKEQVVDKVNNIDSNLKQVLGAVIKIESDIHASKEVALKSLARLERLPEESLTGEAHKIVKRRVLGHKK